MSTPELFLYEPRDQLFLDGKERLPYSVRPGHSHLYWTLAALAVIAAVWLFFKREENLHHYLKAHGVKTTAVVLRTYTVDDDHDTYERVTFRYVARDGDQKRTITRSHAAPRNFFLGERIDVVYDPANPDVVRIAEGKDLTDPERRAATLDGVWLITAFPAFLAVMTGPLWIGTQLLPLLRLRRRPGQVLDGELTECTGYTDSSDVFHIIVLFRFTTPEGKILNGWMPARRRDDLEKTPLPTPGTPVKVYYVDGRKYWCL